MDKKSNRLNSMRVILVIPVVLVMIFIFFWLTRDEIIRLSKEEFALQSQNSAEEIDAWAKQIISELNIYNEILAATDLEDEEKTTLLEMSAGRQDAYPYGLYWGDEAGNYFDSSGWVPGEDYVITERNWYREGLEHEKFAFGEPYVDAMTGDVCVSVSVRVKNSEHTSVLAADVYLDYASQVVAESVNIENAFFVTGESRIILVNSNTSLVGKALEEQEDNLLYQNINELLDRGEIGQSEVDGDDGLYYVDINKIESTGWYFVTCVRRKNMLGNFYRMQGIMLIVAAIASIILMVIILQVSKSMSVIGTKAKTDPLTKLLNREGFREQVQTALKEHPGEGAMLIIDMDNFKQINDCFGHPTGDLVLKCFAEQLEEYFNRKRDYVARIGGDEFAVFVGRTISEEGEGRIMLEKFVELVRMNFKEKYLEQGLSASIGVSFVKMDSEYEQLYERADAALYEVKKSGKDGFLVK